MGPTLLREAPRILQDRAAGHDVGRWDVPAHAPRDGWIAMNLARAADVDLLAAWMGREWMSEERDGAPWDAVETALCGMNTEEAVERAQLLGIPAAVARPCPRSSNPFSCRPWRAALDRGCAAGGRSRRFVGGPLCARGCSAASARVVKCELAGRPDGAGRTTRVLGSSEWRRSTRRSMYAEVDQPVARQRGRRRHSVQARDRAAGPRSRKSRYGSRPRVGCDHGLRIHGPVARSRRVR